MRLNAAELEQAVILTLKKQMEATAPLAPDGTLRVDASVPERAVLRTTEARRKRARFSAEKMQIFRGFLFTKGVRCVILYILLPHA